MSITASFFGSSKQSNDKATAGRLLELVQKLEADAQVEHQRLQDTLRALRSQLDVGTLQREALQQLHPYITTPDFAAFARMNATAKAQAILSEAREYVRAQEAAASIVSAEIIELEQSLSGLQNGIGAIPQIAPTGTPPTSAAGPAALKLAPPQNLVVLDANSGSHEAAIEEALFAGLDEVIFTPDVPAVPRTDTKHVLIIEDNRVIEHLLCQCLEPAGYTTTIARSDKEAAQIISETAPPTIVLLDASLPQSASLPLIHKIRYSKTWGNTPIIMLTTPRGIYDVSESLKAGANDYLPKTCSPSDLIAKIRSFAPEVPGERKNSARPSSASEKFEVV